MRISDWSSDVCSSDLLADVRSVIHVDEVDHDQPRHVAQAKLARNLMRGLEVGAERGLPDIMFARRAARVDVDRHQRLSRVDDEIATRIEMHAGVQTSRELIPARVAWSERDGVGILLTPPRTSRHN